MPKQTSTAQTSTDHSTAAIIAAWDAFSDGDYSAPALNVTGTLSITSDAPAELRDLAAVAAFELGRQSEDATIRFRDLYAPGQLDTGLFASLAAGYAALNEHEYDRAAELLGQWLLNRDYHAPVVFERFLEAARSGERFRLMGDVSKKFISRPAYQSLAVQGFFLSNFHQERFKEAVLVFEKFRELVNDSIIQQKAALAMMRLGRYQDAETLLAPLYTRVTGAEYRMRYDELRAEYEATADQRDALAKKKNRSYDESMELGMAYLFSSDYDRALQVFQGLMKKQAA